MAGNDPKDPSVDRLEELKKRWASQTNPGTKKDVLSRDVEAANARLLKMEKETNDLLDKQRDNIKKISELDEKRAVTANKLKELEKSINSTKEKALKAAAAGNEAEFKALTMKDKRLRTERDNARKNYRDTLDGIKKTRTEYDKLYNSIDGHEAKHSKLLSENLRTREQALKTLAKEEQTLKNLSKLGPLGQGLTAAREATGGASKLAAGLKGATAGVGELVGGNVGSFLANVATGNVAGAAIDLGKAAADAAMTIDDKLSKLSANYIKATGTISDSNEEAIASIRSMNQNFKVAYSDSIESLMRFGISHDRAYEAVARFSKSIQPSMKDQGAALTRLAKDSYQYATMLDSTQEETAANMEAAFQQFGHGAKEVSRDLQSVYGVLDAANDRTVAGFDRAIVRMKDFSNIIFESSRKADLWSFSYEDVSSLLGALAQKTATAGMAEEKRQKIAKGIVGFTQGGGPEWINQMAGQAFMTNMMAQVGGASGADLDELLKKKGYKDETVRRNIAERIEGVRKGQPAALAGQSLLTQISNEDSQRALLTEAQKVLAGIGTGPGAVEGRMQIMKQFFPDMDEGSRQYVQRELLGGAGTQTGGDIDALLKEMARLREEGAKKQPKTGAEAISAASEGLSNSMKELLASQAELALVTGLAGDATWMLAQVIGKDKVGPNPMERAKMLKANASRSKSVKEGIEKSGLNPLDVAQIGVMADNDTLQRRDELWGSGRTIADLRSAYEGQTNEQLLKGLYAEDKDLGKAAGKAAFLTGGNEEQYKVLLRSLLQDQVVKQAAKMEDTSALEDLTAGTQLNPVKVLAEARGIPMESAQLQYDRDTQARKTRNEEALRMRSEGFIPMQEASDEEANRAMFGRGAFVERGGQMWIRVDNWQAPMSQSIENASMAPGKVGP